MHSIRGCSSTLVAIAVFAVLALSPSLIDARAVHTSSQNVKDIPLNDILDQLVHLHGDEVDTKMQARRVQDDGPIITFSNTLGDHMVLQREQAAFVWGAVSPGVGPLIVTVGTTTVLTNQSRSIWVAKLPPFPASGPYNVTATLTPTDGSPPIQNALTDVMFGDVFFCSGQSNMQFTLYEAFNSTSEIAAAQSYSNIRVMTVGQGNSSSTPVFELLSIEQPWAVGSSASVGGPPWKYFSAVCWLYGKKLSDSLKAENGTAIPVGLISSNWGGTYIQAWSSQDALNKCAQPSKDPKKKPNVPMILYNSMVVPFLPMRLKGVVWYQGESNVPLVYGGPQYYLCAFPAMINDWRTKFNSPQLPFLFVQLAAYINTGDELLADMRAAQWAATKLPGVGMATAIDAGDLASPWNQIHPRDKEIVGTRLDATARHIIYGDTSVEYQGPVVQSAAAQSDGSVLLTYKADPLSPAGLFVKQNVTCPPQGTAKPGVCHAFQFILPISNAPAVECLNPIVTLVSPWTVQVKCPAPIANGSALFYGIADYPLLSIYNTAGNATTPFLPAQPFKLIVGSSTGEVDKRSKTSVILKK